MSIPVVPAVPDVPDLSADWYLRIVAVVAGWPGALRAAAEFAAEGVLLVFAAVVLLLWWRARRGPVAAMALALAAPVATVLGYLVSEAAKHVKRVDRPCRLLDVATVAPCPEPGDWSFPSNHAAVAGAAAVAICWSGARLPGAVAALAALCAAALRVVVGLHFPHDVLAGLLVGAVVAAAATPLIARAVRPMVAGCRARSIGAALVGSGRG
ncbi:phosphatase PAP2 family protein [Pseudonocardia humida]|uniref:Phosphatase PAP2 family protein n=1 Tax=Pseudonocardia humida TaxID=2800819 RepID=A0ABT1A7F1_9PSEU|nr:phosphatase PAP2 family protein [Pseudonocardia humida]MCO1658950.1 phosphatase PAP2 family protein [Pseudonocardia humida]